MRFSDYLERYPPYHVLARSGRAGARESYHQHEEPPPRKQVLIFDQFEEILTIDPTDRPARVEFFAQVGAALEDRNRWALFVMREDYTAALDPYMRPIPTRFSTSFRLDLLGIAAAHLAIQEPARSVGVDFSEAAATRLVDDLRRVRVQGADGTVQVLPGPYIEPVQLQVVCYNLWERLPPETTTITEIELEMVGNVDNALADYYDASVSRAALKTGVSERAIRDWFEYQLITEQHIRGQIVHGVDQSSGLDNCAIEHLISSHLVRAEKRRGVVWLELAHDRLIEPLCKNNAAWREANLSMLQRQSAMWDAHGRTNDLLLRDRVLREAEQWAEAHRDELTSTEREFLQESREARVYAERERRKNRIIEGLAMVAVAVSILALTAFVVAAQERNRADEARAALINWQKRATASAIEVEQATREAGIASTYRMSAQEMIETMTGPPQGVPTGGPQQATLEALERTVMAAEQTEQSLGRVIQTATAVQEEWGREVTLQETDIAEQGITTYPPPMPVPTSRAYPPPTRTPNPTPTLPGTAFTATARRFAVRETTVSRRETRVTLRETQVARTFTALSFPPPTGTSGTATTEPYPIGTVPAPQETTRVTTPATIEPDPPYPEPATPLPLYPTLLPPPTPGSPTPTSTPEPVPYPVLTPAEEGPLL